MNFRIVLIGLLVSLSEFLSAQPDAVSTIDSLDKTYLNWQNRSPFLDAIEGSSIDRANEEILKNITHREKIVVAVIDGGVDIDHDDLKGKIWTNTGEISDNGIDDDGNGYIDDIHGWNFLGNAKGEDIEYETYEFVRLLRKYDTLFANVNSAEQVSADQQADYKTYLACKLKYDEIHGRYSVWNDQLKKFEEKIDSQEHIIEGFLNKNTYTQQDLSSINTYRKDVMQARKFLLLKYRQGFSHKRLDDMKHNIDVSLNMQLNADYNPRTIIGDDIENINDRGYGNNHVNGPHCFHGTFVAGIIAANRANGIGIDGITDSVEIMVLRAVPDGDEYDKDVALAIYYAVENGARIINMSFGKAFSPQKEMVYDAIRYAESRNVLLIHGAGNDGENVDINPHYPIDRFPDSTLATNFITAGAISMKSDKHFCGSFSNYGKSSVDLFAPGVNIISLFSGNEYALLDGTSFSCPMVSGTAALVLSCYPSLSAVELKNIILSSCSVYPKLKVLYPNLKGKQRKKAMFADLSRTGGTLNAYTAIKMAEAKYSSAVVE
jgi:subtilisin family serine protease